MELLLAAVAAAWLGLLTAISPCPLATNIAAISYVGKRVDQPRLVLLSGLIYTLGRTLSYVLVALVVVRGLLSVPVIARFLQQNLNLALGPLLIAVGLLLLDVLPWPWVATNSGLFEKLQKRADRLGLMGAGLLGFAFALAFCPVSAALFFGSLLPLAIQHESALLLPAGYGLGTALPVVGFSLVLAFATNWLSRVFNALTLIERWMRRITAVVFVGVGAYYCLTYLLGVL